MYQASSASDPIKFAAVFSTTGIAANHKEQMIKMAKLAVLTINKEGGILDRQVELVVLDNQSTPIGSALAARKAVELGVAVVIGANWSSHSLAMAPVLQEAQIPMISPSSTNPQVTHIGDYIFRVCFLDSFQGMAMAKFAREDIGVETTVVVSNLDEEYSIDLAKFYKKNFGDSGGKVLADFHYRGDATDFSDIVNKVKALAPEVIYLPGYTRDSSLFMKQARKMGVNSIFLGGDAWDGIIVEAGEAVNGSYQTVAWNPMVDHLQSQKMKELYFQQYSSAIDSFTSPLVFDAVMIAKQAIENCNSTDGQKIKDALFAITSFQGATGDITFDENGDPRNKQVIILRFEQSQPLFIKALRP